MPRLTEQTRAEPQPWLANDIYREGALFRVLSDEEVSHQLWWAMTTVVLNCWCSSQYLQQSLESEDWI